MYLRLFPTLETTSNILTGFRNLWIAFGLVTSEEELLAIDIVENKKDLRLLTIVILFELPAFDHLLQIRMVNLFQLGSFRKTPMIN